MLMICPFMAISASTELREFLYISCRKNTTHSFGASNLLAPGAHAPCSLPAATDHMLTGIVMKVQKLP